VEDLIEEVTRGNVTEVKVVLASIVAALAVYQVFLMAVGYRKVRLSALKPKVASFTHRAVGDSILVLTLVVAWMCSGYFGISDGIEHARPGEELRAAIHVVSALALLGVLTLKVIVVRWWHSLGRFLPHFGLTVFTLFVIVWVSSAGDYLWGG